MLGQARSYAPICISVTSNGPCSRADLGVPGEVAGVAGVEDLAARAGDHPGAPERAVAAQPPAGEVLGGGGGDAPARRPGALSDQSSSTIRSAGTPHRSRCAPTPSGTRNGADWPVEQRLHGGHVEVVVVVVGDQDGVQPGAARRGVPAARAADAGRPGPRGSSGRSRPGRAAPGRPSISISAEACPYQTMLSSPRRVGGVRCGSGAAAARARSAVASACRRSAPGPGCGPGSATIVRVPAGLWKVPSRNCGERAARSARAPASRPPSAAGTSRATQARPASAASPAIRHIRRPSDRSTLIRCLAHRRPLRRVPHTR